MLNYLAEHIKKHPQLQPRDVAKFCYQAARGPEHLLEDTVAAENYLNEELARVSPAPGEMVEVLSEDFVRIELGVWKYKKLPADWLLRMFAASAAHRPEGQQRLAEYLDSADSLLSALPFSGEEWTRYLSEYKEQGMPPVRHSPLYRELYSPAYRVVDRRFVRILPILEHLADLRDKKPCIIAIDGRAASGKSTVAADLAMILGCDVIHMDDFFLPFELRGRERLDEPGGNVHYERFAEEVLPNIRTGEFSYRVFDCGILDYNGQRHIKSAEYRIVEGSYSLHPKFGDYADLTVFSNVEQEEQLRRILKRDGEKMLEMFREKWIPMEERYISAFGIKEKADLCI